MAITVGLLLLYPASAHAQGGVPLLTNRFSNGSAIAVDRCGDVFLTGPRMLPTSSLTPRQRAF
jgi:hypothetical protein